MLLLLVLDLHSVTRFFFFFFHKVMGGETSKTTQLTCDHLAQHDRKQTPQANVVHH